MRSLSLRSGTGVRVETALLVVAVILLVALVPRIRGLEREGLIELSQLGHWAPVVLIAGYSVAAALLLPAFPLDFAAGAHFDFWLGVLWVQVAATLASVTGHFLGATVLRGAVDKFLLKRPKLRRLREAVQEEGWRMVFLTRLSPVFSFSMLNFVFGAARVPLRSYVAATFVGMLPGTALYVYAGTLAGNLSGSPDNPPQPTWHWVAQTLGFLGTIILVVYVTRRAQRVLGKRIET
jgi:uncharacterized membrane protein YdjX (TVP38/TMEM64 family)